MVKLFLKYLLQSAYDTPIDPGQNPEPSNENNHWSQENHTNRKGEAETHHHVAKDKSASARYQYKPPSIAQII